MKRLRNFILLLVFVFASVVFAVEDVSHPVQDHTDAAGEITLTVKVVNATASGTTVEGDKAFVEIYHHGKKFFDAETEVDAAGLAVFKNVIGGTHFQAVVRVKHNDVMFGRRPVSLDSSGDDVNYKVEVYDVSFDNSVLRVGSHDINIKIAGNSLLVTEYMQLVNPTYKAVASNAGESGKPRIIEISLPTGFSELKCIEYFAESAIVVTEGGFYDIMAIPPGMHNAAFSYKVDLGDRAFWDFQKKITMPTNDLQVFSQLGRGVLEGLGRAVGRSNGPDGTEAQKYAASSYKAGDKLAFQISTMEESHSDWTTEIVIACVFVLLFIVFAIFCVCY